MIESDSQYYIDGVLAGDRRILAKTITMIESSRPSHQVLAGEILEALVPRSGRAIRIGITGVPGVGKSTFIEAFGLYLTGLGKKLVVLAVDPSSSRSGGSIMADKTRMERLAINPGAFIRPSPSGQNLGGVARKTRETLMVCEAAGFDVVLVETVGVGQSETTVASMVDFFLVLMLAGAGDELQGIKRGVMELADAIAVNKADGDNVQKAEKARRIYENALHLMTPATPTWTPPVLTCSALEMTGINTLWQAAMSHHERLSATGELAKKRQKQARSWLWSLLEEGLKRRFLQHPDVVKRLPATLRAVEHDETSPTAAARELLFLLDKAERV